MALRSAVTAALLLGSACAHPPEAGAPPSAAARDFEAGPIWSQADAELKCPVVARAVLGEWNGQWATVAPNQMSVCGIIGATRMALMEAANVEVGPIWDQSDAQVKCPAATVALGARWSGHWWTTEWGKMSVCALAPK